MQTPASQGKRVAAIAAVVALVLGFPVLIVLLAVVDDRWRPVVGGCMGVLVAVTFAGWLYTLAARRGVTGGDPTDAPDPS